MYDTSRSKKKRYERDNNKIKRLKITAKTGHYFSSASSKREDPAPGGGEGDKEGLVHPYPWYRVGVAQL